MTTGTVFSYEEAVERTREYFGGDELATASVVGKYLLKNGQGEFLESNPDDYLKNRLAPEFARIEQKYPNSITEEEIYNAFKDFRYIVCQGSPTFGIGNDHQVVSLANCFVVGQPHDSYGGILQKDQELAQIMKRRGGAGIDISTIRPSGSAVRNCARTSDGIAVFMQRFSNTTKEVAQGGRRGALLIGLDCRHPDIDTFITVKRDLTRITGANISVKWRDDFLEAVEKDEEYVLRYPVDAEPEDATYTRTVRAKEVWDTFVTSAWASGEPGCMFWDTILRQSISDCYTEDGFGTVISNPCGEIMMSTYNACILMTMNLTGFVDSPYTKNARVSWKRFDKYVRIATRLIDDLVDLELEKVDAIMEKIVADPEPKEVKRAELNLWDNIRDRYKLGRRTGLGITALADMIAMLGMKYDSPEAKAFSKKLFSTYQNTVYDESAELAAERGVFPCWDWEKEKNSPYIKQLSAATKQKVRNQGRRNIASLTIAPVGTISLCTRTSSGIEPVFKLVYTRNKKMTQEEEEKGIEPSFVDDDGVKWSSFDVHHNGLVKWMDVTGNDDPQDSPYSGCDCEGIDWRARVQLQSTIQQYIDHSISSTVNLPGDITEEEVSEIYMAAWKGGCKGITIYREGSRKGVLVSREDEDDRIQDASAPKRPKVLECDIHYSNIKHREKGGVNQWIFFVGKLNGQVYEIFGGRREHLELPKKYTRGWIKKNGKNERGLSTYDLVLGTLEESDERFLLKDMISEFSPDPGSYTRLISMGLRHGIPARFICEQLLKDSEAHMFTFEKGISRVLRKYVKEGEQSSDTCPKCSNKTLEYRSGCIYCSTPGCGWSKCD